MKIRRQYNIHTIPTILALPEKFHSPVLPVWQEANKLAEEVYDTTESKDFPYNYSLRDQLE